MSNNWLYVRDHFWFDLTVGGSVAHTSGVINALTKRIDLNILSNDELPNLAVTNYIIKKPYIRFPKEIAEFIYSFRILVQLIKIKPSHIYTRYSGFSIGALCYKLFYPKTILILEFNSSDYWKLKNWSYESNSKLKKSLYTFYVQIIQIPLFALEKIQLHHSDRVVVVSQILKSQLMKIGLSDTKIKFYHNGVDKDLFKNIESNRKVVNCEVPYFIFVGTFGQWHGIEFILNSFKIFAEKNKNGKLIMIGNGPRFLYAKDFITKYGLENRINLLGEQTNEETLRYIKGSIGCINASMNNPDGTKFFGSPTKLFEYFLSERITLCSSVGELEQDFKKMALFFETTNPESLAKLLELVITDQIDHISIAKYAKSEVIKRFSWDKHIEVVLDGII